MKIINKILVFGLLFVVSSSIIVAEDKPFVSTDGGAKKEFTTETLSTLLTYVELQEQIQAEIKALKRMLKKATSDTEKNDYKEQLGKAEKKLKGTTTNLESIAADTDLSILRAPESEPFNLQKELFSLLEPALKEMKHATSDVRLKSQLREKVTYYEQRKPIAKQALQR